VSSVNGLRAPDIEQNTTWPFALLHLFIAGLAFLTVPRSAEEYYGRRQFH
jgi:hypothetical protein